MTNAEIGDSNDDVSSKNPEFGMGCGCIGAVALLALPLAFSFSVYKISKSEESIREADSQFDTVWINSGRLLLGSDSVPISQTAEAYKAPLPSGIPMITDFYGYVSQSDWPVGSVRGATIGPGKCTSFLLPRKRDDSLMLYYRATQDGVQKVDVTLDSTGYRLMACAEKANNGSDQSVGVAVQVLER